MAGDTLDRAARAAAPFVAKSPIVGASVMAERAADHARAKAAARAVLETAVEPVAKAICWEHCDAFCLGTGDCESEAECTNWRKFRRGAMAALGLTAHQGEAA